MTTEEKIKNNIRTVTEKQGEAIRTKVYCGELLLADWALMEGHWKEFVEDTNTTNEGHQ